MVDVYRVAGNEIVAEEEYTGSEYSDESYYESDEWWFLIFIISLFKIQVNYWIK